MFRQSARPTFRPTQWWEVVGWWMVIQIFTLLAITLMVALFYLVYIAVDQTWENGRVIFQYAAVFGMGWALVFWLFSAQIVIWGTQATKLPDDHMVTKRLKVLARRIFIRSPKGFIISQGSLNAFATGVKLPIPFFGGRGVVGVTEGLLEAMEDDELDFVFAHELTHLVSLDLILASLATGLALGLTALLRLILRYPSIMGNIRFRRGSVAPSFSTGSTSGFRTRPRGSSSGGSKKDGCNPLGWLLTGLGAFLKAAWEIIATILVILAVVLLITLVTQIAIPLISSFINRQRELWADAFAAWIIGSPEPGIRALGKLQRATNEVEGVGQSLNMFFNVSAFEPIDTFDKLFSSHPSIDYRIKRLVNLCN